MRVPLRWLSDFVDIELPAEELARVLRLAPKGLRFDQPTSDVFRRRLTALADVVASAVDAA